MISKLIEHSYFSIFTRNHKLTVLLFTFWDFLSDISVVFALHSLHTESTADYAAQCMDAYGNHTCNFTSQEICSAHEFMGFLIIIF